MIDSLLDSEAKLFLWKIIQKHIKNLPKIKQNHMLITLLRFYLIFVNFFLRFWRIFNKIILPHQRVASLTFFLRIHLVTKLSNLNEIFGQLILIPQSFLLRKYTVYSWLLTMYEMKKKHAFLTRCVQNFNQWN